MFTPEDLTRLSLEIFGKKVEVTVISNDHLLEKKEEKYQGVISSRNWGGEFVESLDICLTEGKVITIPYQIIENIKVIS